MTYDEATELISDHTDYGGFVDGHALATALSTAPTTGSAPVAWIKTRKSNGETELCGEGPVKHLALFDGEPRYTHPASPAASMLTDDWQKYRTIAVCVAQKLGGKDFAEAMRLQFDKAKPLLAASVVGASPAASVLNRSAFSDIVNERIRQTEQWGGVAHDDTHGSRDWFRFIAQQQEKCREAITETLNQQDWGHITNAYGEELIREETRMRLVKIAALAIAGIESNDRAALLAASVVGDRT